MRDFAIGLGLGSGSLVAAVALYWLWRVEQEWRPMIRGYLERRVGAALPEKTEKTDPPPGPGHLIYPNEERWLKTRGEEN